MTLDDRQAGGMWRLRLDRLTERVTGSWPIPSDLGSREAAVSLVQVSRAVELTPAQVDAIDEVLHAACGELTARIERVDALRLDAWRAHWLYRAWSDDEFSGQVADFEATAQAVTEATERLDHALAALIGKLQATLTAMGQELDADSAGRLADCYTRAAFPDIFAWRYGMAARCATMERSAPMPPVVQQALDESIAICQETMAAQRAWDAALWGADELRRARLRYQMQQLEFDRRELESRMSRTIGPGVSSTTTPLSPSGS